MKDFLYMKSNGLRCKGQDVSRCNKKADFCSNCIRALPCNDGTVCPHGLDIYF